MKLFDQARRLNALKDLMDSDDGDTPEQAFADTIELAELTFTAKIESCVAVMREVDAEASALKKEEERLAKRRKSLESKAKWLKGYVHACMTEAGETKVKTDLFTVSRRKNPWRCVVDDESRVPSLFKRTKTIEEVDKSRILDHLAKGLSVEGASREQTESLTVR